MNQVNVLTKIATYYQLGLINLITVFIYRVALKIGYFSYTQPIEKIITHQLPFSFFHHTKVAPSLEILSAPTKAFGWLSLNENQVPKWHTSITTLKTIKNNNNHWSQLSDFNLNIGDIKTIWEQSRFDWLLSFSIEYIRSGDQVNLDKINDWLTSWCKENPANQGVNWKCGQEASIRVLHISISSYLLKQDKNLSPALAKLIFLHLKRISPTRFYAMAQDNNHGTSEASALYIGSLLLKDNKTYSTNKEVKLWHKQGRFWLENRVKKLIDIDGTFSQNSVNYHRLMLDCLSLVEFFRKTKSQPRFSKAYYQKIKMSCRWLKNMTNSINGHTPNLGLNDGANLLPITSCDYADYRPSIQWAYSLFFNTLPYPISGQYHQLTSLLPNFNKEEIQEDLDSPKYELTEGVHLIKNEMASVYIRTPNTKFRPSSCDALHLDFWLGPDNILQDSGSYSYNCDPKIQEYFPSTKAHNTIQFDNKEQMPKISRFLYGHWINTHVSTISKNTVIAKYLNNANHSHSRKVSLTDTQLIITDKVDGFLNKAELYWHLSSDNWLINNNTVKSKVASITVDANVNITSIMFVEGYKSRYYLKKEESQVLKIIINEPGTVTTTINWSL